MTPIFGFNLNAEAFQKQRSDTTEIHNFQIGVHKPQSRYSSDGEGGLQIGRNNSQGNEGSDYAMGGLSNSQQIDDRCNFSISQA